MEKQNLLCVENSQGENEMGISPGAVTEFEVTQKQMVKVCGEQCAWHECTQEGCEPGSQSWVEASSAQRGIFS